MCMNHNGRHLLRFGAFALSLLVMNKVTINTVSIITTTDAHQTWHTLFAMFRYFTDVQE